MSSKTVHFSVDGQWLADFARTRHSEGDWQAAVQLLTDGLDGLTTDQAIAIVRGHATLTGDSNVGIEYQQLPEDGEVATNVAEREQYMYQGLFKHKDKLYRPYAEMAELCKAKLREGNPGADLSKMKIEHSRNMLLGMSSCTASL